MKTFAVILLVAGAIRVATGIDPVLAAGLVGALAAGATGYGLWTHRRFQVRPWLTAWSLLGLGLLLEVAGSVLQAAGSGARPVGVAAGPLAFTLGGEAVAAVGLCLLIHLRMPGRSPEVLTTAVVAVLAVAFALLGLVVLPAQGWRPGVQLPAMAVPAGEFVLIWLTGSLMSMSERHPAGYRYLLGGTACLFFAHALGSASSLATGGRAPMALDAVALWGTCLWGCAVLHPSQRVAFEPVPLRSTRPTWPHVGLLVAATLVVPGILAVQTVLGESTDRVIVVAGSAVLPILVVLYLLHQVFARSAAEYRAQHDALTGVCNRVLFNDSLAAALVDARRSDSGLALMFLDLDRFKSINDSLGHAVGNQLLQAVVKRLQFCLRPRDILARMGGDEFTVLFPDITDKSQAANLAERVLRAFEEPFNVGGHLLPVQASIGVAIHPEDGDDVDELFKHADTAMYQAKSSGRNTYVIYDTAMSARAQLRFALESSLRSALELGRLAVHYQPKFSATDGTMVGVEALARWHHPRLGMIPPWAFIPLAEETSLIATLGEWVLETACAQAKKWQEWAPPNFSVAVNLSPRQFVCQSVVGMVGDVLDRTGLQARHLELEVTESVLMEHMDEAVASLAELRSMGVRCSIDDFGTGYSALTYLTDIPVDAIKIDPSFVRRIDSESGAAPIVGAVIALAHSLQLQVVAEGVETDSQFEFLQAHRCDYVQGFRFSAPVTAEEIEGMLRDHVELPGLAAGGRRLAGAPVESSVLPSARLSTLLAGVASQGGWAQQPDGADVEAVLLALQIGDPSALGAAKALGLVPARMAFGTLAGLASIAGGLGAAGALPRVSQAIAAQVLQQATGIADMPPSGGPRPAELAVGTSTAALGGPVPPLGTPVAATADAPTWPAAVGVPSAPGTGIVESGAAGGTSGSQSGGGNGGSGGGSQGSGGGQTGSPGQSGDAPGQTGNTPGQSAGAPGKSASAPGQASQAGASK